MPGPNSDVSAIRSQSRYSEDDDVKLYFPHVSTSNGSPATGNEQTPEPNPEQMYDSMFDADAEDDLMDMGLQIGRLSISERFVGSLRRLVNDSLLLRNSIDGNREPDADMFTE